MAVPRAITLGIGESTRETAPAPDAHTPLIGAQAMIASSGASASPSASESPEPRTLPLAGHASAGYDATAPPRPARA